MKKQTTTVRLIDTAAQRTKASIVKSLDSMPLVIQQRMGIVAFTPTMPETQQEADEWIEHFAEHIVKQAEANGALREHVLGRLERRRVNVSRDTPPSVLRLVVINTCKAVSAQVLLEVGVFGRPCSAEQAQATRMEMVEAIYQEMLQKAGKTN